MQLESTLHVWPSPTPMQLPEALQTRPPLSVHDVPAEACAVPQQPMVHVFVRQRVGGEGQSLGVVHEVPPSHAGDALPSLVAESASESGPALASESPGDPSLLAESASESASEVAPSPEEPSVLAESAAESGPTLVPESPGEPELPDEPPLLDEPPLDPEPPPELEVVLPPDPDPLPLEDTDVASFSPASSPSSGLAPLLPQLAATRRATAVAMALVSCLEVGIVRRAIGAPCGLPAGAVNPGREAALGFVVFRQAFRTISNGRIISFAACSRLWQCHT